MSCSIRIVPRALLVFLFDNVVVGTAELDRTGIIKDTLWKVKRTPRHGGKGGWCVEMFPPRSWYTTPLHHHTTTPRHHYTTPLHHHTTTPLHHYCTAATAKVLEKSCLPSDQRNLNDHLLNSALEQIKSAKRAFCKSARSQLYCNWHIVCTCVRASFT